VKPRKFRSQIGVWVSVFGTSRFGIPRSSAFAVGGRVPCPLGPVRVGGGPALRGLRAWRASGRVNRLVWGWDDLERAAAPSGA
jgi:hypothetical protein